MRETSWWVVVLVATTIGCGHKAEKNASEAPTESQAVIEVRNGTPSRIREEIIRYADITTPEKAGRFDVRILERGGTTLVVLPKGFPPYSFLNLVSWLDAPPDTKDVSGATGWYSAPLTEQRLCVRLETANAVGDTVLAADRAGKTYRIYLPDISMCELDTRAEFHTEPGLPTLMPPVAFSVVVDTSEDFGNPNLAITHPRNTRW